MRKNLRLISYSLLYIFFVSPVLCLAQSQDKVYSVFLFSFVKYISWPDNAPKAEFVIGVIGNKEMVSELTKVAATKKAGDLAIKIVEYSTSETNYNCHLLFVAESNISAIDNVTKKMASHTVLVVGKDGFAKKTGGIDLFLQGDKIKFNINKTALEKRSIKVSSQMLNLGTVI